MKLRDVEKSGRDGEACSEKRRRSGSKSERQRGARRLAENLMTQFRQQAFDLVASCRGGKVPARAAS